MTNSFRRFAFDREFAADGTVLRDGEKIKRILTEAEAQSLAQEAADTARRSEEAEAAKEAAAALKQVSGKLQAMTTRLDAESEAMRADAVRLAVAAARAIAGAALDQFGADTIEACAKEALSDLRAEPRIAVRVAPHLADVMAERLYAFAEAEGFGDAVVVRADAETGHGDCVIEWRSGAVERTAAEIESRIQAAVETWLARPAEERDAPKVSGEKSDQEPGDESSGGAAA